MLTFLQHIIWILFCCAFFLVMRFNIHMFQLNAYHRDEHDVRMKKEAGKLAPVIFTLVTAFFANLFPNYVTFSLVIIGLVWTIALYNHYRVAKVKKRFVYTPRMIRLIATIIAMFLICILICSIIIYSCGKSNAILSLGIALWLLPFSITFADLINSPLEKKIKNGFIKEAEDMIADMPQLKVIGITGSYGKTSLKYYLGELLGVKYNVLITPESYNTPMGVVKTVRENLRPIHEFFVCEMGARHVGDIKEICDIVNPDYGIITAVGPQHLETFYSIENVVNTKFELADAVPADGKVFLNFDNKLIEGKAIEYEGKIVSYSCDCDASYKADSITLSASGTEFTVTAPNGETEHFLMQLIGMHNVQNVLGAIACANYFGVALKDMKPVVRKLQPVKHRLELINKGPFTVIDDAFNSNPAGAASALSTISLFDGTRILITPGMIELGDREEELNKEFGSKAAKCCDHIILIGSRRTQPIKDGAVEAGFDPDRIKVFEKFIDGYNYAASLGSDRRKYILLENDLPDNY